MSAPGTLGAITAVPPVVERHIDGDQYVVTVSLANEPDVLTLLARAIGKDEHLAHAWRILIYNATPYVVGDRLRAQSLGDLMASPAVRDALTVTLSPGVADDLADQLADASREPDYCDMCRDRFAVRDDRLCEGCGDAEDNHHTLDECAT